MVIISWTAPAIDWSMQQSPTLAAGSWDNLSTDPVQAGTLCVAVEVGIEPGLELSQCPPKTVRRHKLL